MPLDDVPKVLSRNDGLFGFVIPVDAQKQSTTVAHFYSMRSSRQFLAHPCTWLLQADFEFTMRNLHVSKGPRLEYFAKTVCASVAARMYIAIVSATLMHGDMSSGHVMLASLDGVSNIVRANRP